MQYYTLSREAPIMGAVLCGIEVDAFCANLNVPTKSMRTQRFVSSVPTPFVLTSVLVTTHNIRPVTSHNKYDYPLTYDPSVPYSRLPTGGMRNAQA